MSQTGAEQARPSAQCPHMGGDLVTWSPLGRPEHNGNLEQGNSRLQIGREGVGGGAIKPLVIIAQNILMAPSSVLWNQPFQDLHFEITKS